MELPFDLLALLQFEIAVVQKHRLLEIPLLAQPAIELIATAAAIGKQQNFAGVKTQGEIVNKRDQLPWFAFEMNQMRTNLALYRVGNPDRIGLQSKALAYGIRSGQCRRQGNFLQAPVIALFEPLYEIRQMTAAIAIDQLMHLVHGNRRHSA